MRPGNGRNPKMAVQIKSPREALRAELEDTRKAYHALLADIPDTAWEKPTANPAWNVRQMMWHMTMAPRFLPQDIKMLRNGRSFKPPAWLFNWLNIWYTRWGSRQATKASVAAAYDVAHEEVIALLDTIRDDEWNLAGEYPDINANLPGGQQTIADIFHYLTIHFREHEADIRSVLDS